MTFSSITATATSGLAAAQTGIKTVSDNITNVNTTGYVRKVVDQSATVVGGVSVGGVSVSGVTRAADQFLENTSLSASADVGKATAVSDLLGQAQSLLGDPSSTTGYFNQLNNVYSAFAAAANDPAAALSSTDAVNQVSEFLNQSKSVASSINGLSTQADTKIAADVSQINQLLAQISTLNTSIATNSAAGGDVTDAQNAQSTLTTQLSSLMDVQVTQTASGGVTLRTQSGQTLVGQAGAATLAYTPSTSASSQVTIAQPGGGNQPVALSTQSGELNGLLNLRNATLPNVEDQLNEFVTQAVNALNQAHNASSTVPAPSTLTGQPVSTDIPTALNGFTGKTNIAVVNSSGVVQQQVTIDFTAGTITPAGGSAVNFNSSNFVSTLNSALGGSATVSVNSANNALSISASGTGDGVAIADDPTTPSSKNGVGFSQYFGLNNLITTTGVTNYATGLQASDTSGFAGGTIDLRLTDANGDEITDQSVTIPSGGTIQGVIDALNARSNGVGIYGSFSLDSAGELSFTPTTPGSAAVSVVSDNTQWGSSGTSVSQLFGIGAATRAGRIDGFSVRADIASTPTNIAFAQLNLNVAAGQPALSIGDGSGALALSNAGSSTQSFEAAGGFTSSQTSVLQYGAQLAGALGAQASAATNAVTNATAVQTEADSRRQSVEGVNLDQELVNLTTYQQAYSASSRLITATTDMFTALMNM